MLRTYVHVALRVLSAETRDSFYNIRYHVKKLFFAMQHISILGPDKNTDDYSSDPLWRLLNIGLWRWSHALVQPVSARAHTHRVYLQAILR
jgi:hypothetical protein